jgi:hypothetical protein
LDIDSDDRLGNAVQNETKGGAGLFIGAPTLSFRHIGILKDRYAVSGNGMKMFGVLDLETGFEEFATAQVFGAMPHLGLT